MPKVSRKAEVCHPALKMLSLVQQVDKYSEFVPACVEGRVVMQGEGFIHARLAFAKGNVKQAFTTKNTVYAADKVVMELVDGPFKVLYGEWTFRPLAQGCEVGFELEFEFSNIMFKMMFQPLFKQLAAELLQAFCRRADAVYG